MYVWTDQRLGGMLFENTLQFGVFLLVVMVTSVWSHGSHGTSPADHHDFDKETIQDKEYVGTLMNNMLFNILVIAV